MPNRKTKIIFIRHGKTFANNQKCWSGRSNAQLSEEGIEQSKNVVSLLQKAGIHKISTVYSSPLERAVFMAAIISKEFNADLIVEEKIIERNFGMLESKAVNENDKNEMSNWSLNSSLDMNVEKIQEMYFERIKPFILDVICKNNGKTVVVVSHSWVGRLLRFYFSGEKNKSLIAISPHNATPIIFEI